MRAITLHQPWATAVALGIKRVETRSWPTNHRGTVAIHAGARRPPLVTFIGDDWHVAQGATWLHGPGHDVRMPFGQVVAVATITACVPMTEPGGSGHYPMMLDVLDPADGEPHLLLTDSERGTWSDLSSERAWGDYAPGRWAWLLTDVQALPEPVACRGFQRIWNLPPDVEARVLPQLTGWPT